MGAANQWPVGRDRFGSQLWDVKTPSKSVVSVNVRVAVEGAPPRSEQAPYPPIGRGWASHAGTAVGAERRKPRSRDVSLWPSFAIAPSIVSTSASGTCAFDDVVLCIVGNLGDERTFAERRADAGVAAAKRASEHGPGRLITGRRVATWALWPQ